MSESEFMKLLQSVVQGGYCIGCGADSASAANVNCSVLAVYPFADKLVCDAGTTEVLGWMKNAAFVCTYSFHVTCFPIIYRKSFLGVPCSMANTRLQSLLECVDLPLSQMTDPERLGPGDSLFEPLDYSSVEPRLKQAIDPSLDYLRRELA